MEKNLDKVESGKADWHKTVDDFYQGFAASLEQAEKNMEGKKVKVPDEPSSEVCDLCGRPMVIKVGKYGKFLACSRSSGAPSVSSRTPAASAPSAARAVCWSARAPRAASTTAASATPTAIS